VKIVPPYWDEDLECISPELLTEIRTLKMQKHLRYAYQNSRFYQQAFDQAGFRPEEIRNLHDFGERVPFLTHRQMIDNQLADPPFGSFLAVGLKDIRRIYSSPGPLMMPFSISDMEALINTTANGLYICGARRGDIVDITAAYQWQLAGTMLDDAFRRIGCAVVPGGAGMARTHVLVMKHLAVTVIFAFPSFAMTLAEAAWEMGVDPATDLNVRLIIVRKEAHDDHDNEILAHAFGADVREMYAGGETGFVAAECAEGGGLHCFTDSLVEIVDPVDCTTVTDGSGGELVTTDLSRQATPVIRYRTGDVTEGLNLDPCACGRTSPRLKRIMGRVGDIHRVKGTNLLPDLIRDVIRKHGSLRRFQILIDRVRFRDSLTVRVESIQPGNDQSKKQTLIDELRTVALVRPEIEVLPVGAIDENAPIVIDNRFHHVGTMPSAHQANWSLWESDH
jgi:phenylacetate-CoA ligase